MESIVTAFAHLQGNYKFQTSNYVLFLYDHLLTLPDEVEKIWSRPLTFATLLFYINRYITHCQFLILQVEFYETNWPISVRERCDRYVKFAGAATLSLVAIAELVLILRVYGLYLGNKYVLGFLLCILSGQIIVMAWAVHFGVRVPLPPGFSGKYEFLPSDESQADRFHLGCVLTGSSSWFAGLWGAPLCTDTCIFAFTLWRTLRYQKIHGLSSTIKIILRDGTIYFFVIFSVNLMNCLIYLLAVEDLKAMGASFSQIMTSILISRLQLNLREVPAPHSRGSGNVVTSRRNRAHSNEASTTFFTIGNLGEQVEGSFLDTMMGSDTAEEKKNEEAIELHILPESNRA